MYLYHFVFGKRVGVYQIESGVSIEQVFNETSMWPGVRLIKVK